MPIHSFWDNRLIEKNRQNISMDKVFMRFFIQNKLIDKDTY